MLNNTVDVSTASNKSWADIFHEFLNSPPTSSIFRLYLLCFMIWNKGVILYIFFGGADMGDKLAFINWSKFVIPYNVNCSLIFSKILVYISVYIGPTLLATLFYFIVFGFNKKDTPEKRYYSLYNYLYYKHIKEEKKRTDAKKTLEKAIQESLSIEIENIKTEKEILSEKEKNKPSPEDPAWEDSYKKFSKTSFFNNFQDSYRFLYYDKNNNFNFNDINTRFKQELYIYLIGSECFSFVIDNKIFDNNKSNQPGYETIKFNEKGEYYIKYYEWEKGK